MPDGGTLYFVFGQPEYIYGPPWFVHWNYINYLYWGTLHIILERIDRWWCHLFSTFLLVVGDEDKLKTYLQCSHFYARLLKESTLISPRFSTNSYYAGISFSSYPSYKYSLQCIQCHLVEVQKHSLVYCHL